MMEKRFVSSLAKQLLFAGTLTAILCFLAGPATSAEGIDPDADKILKSMSTYLGSLPAFSMAADIDKVDR